MTFQLGLSRTPGRQSRYAAFPRNDDLEACVPPRSKNGNGSEPLGSEDVLWKAADKLRGSMDSSEYKHVVLGLIFLKYVDDAFEERRSVLREELAADGFTGEAAEELLESRDEYTAEGVFWVPPEARWGYLRERRSSRRSAS